MKYDTQFLILINVDMLYTELHNVIVNLCRAGKLEPDSDLNCQGNWLSLHHNEFYDPAKTELPDGYVYYRYRLEVVPTSNTIDVMRQVRFAKALASGLREVGAQTAIGADFEELLES